MEYNATWNTMQHVPSQILKEFDVKDTEVMICSNHLEGSITAHLLYSSYTELMNPFIELIIDIQRAVVYL